jgi:hypothetical protein
VASYWNCYYRSTYPELHTYPGHILLRSLQAAASVTSRQSRKSGSHGAVRLSSTDRQA